jgi:hypothetical protein
MAHLKQVASGLGLPFGNQFLVGAQKYEVLEKLLLSNNVKRRTCNT